MSSLGRGVLLKFFGRFYGKRFGMKHLKGEERVYLGLKFEKIQSIMLGKG